MYNQNNIGMPNQQTQYTIPPQMESVVHVTAEAEMMNYPIAPGNTVYFINDAMGLIYKREVNVYGTQMLPEIYDFKKRTQNVNQQNGDFMTRKEVEDLVLELMTNKEANTNAK